MSKKGKTEIILVVDRSGSMYDIKKEMEGGLNSFLDEQKKLDGEAYVTYHRFDTEFETVFEMKAIEKVEPIVISPRGGTALSDAVGRSINDAIARMERTPEAEKPELVLVYIITDGEENSSREYLGDKPKELVKKAELEYGFKFMFLGADIDSFSVANNFGLGAGSTMNFSKTQDAVNSVSKTLFQSASYYRSAVSQDTAENIAAYSISEDERSAAMSEK